jgi:hypothetical protein
MNLESPLSADYSMLILGCAIEALLNYAVMAFDIRCGSRLFTFTF